MNVILGRVGMRRLKRVSVQRLVQGLAAATCMYLLEVRQLLSLRHHVLTHYLMHPVGLVIACCVAGKRNFGARLNFSMPTNLIINVVMAGEERQGDECGLQACSFAHRQLH
jgi:hypothetical protein